MLDYRAGRIRNAEVVPKPGGTDEVGDSSSGEEEEEGPPTQTAKRQRTQLLQQEHGQWSASERPKRTFPQASSLRSLAEACVSNVLLPQTLA